MAKNNAAQEKAQKKAQHKTQDSALPYRYETEGRTGSTGTAGAVIVQVHVQPGAKTSGWAGRHGDALKLRLSAQAQAGRANAACIRFLAGEAGVPASSVTILRGELSRDKTLRIAPVSPEGYRRLEAKWKHLS